MSWFHKSITPLVVTMWWYTSCTSTNEGLYGYCCSCNAAGRNMKKARGISRLISGECSSLRVYSTLHRYSCPMSDSACFADVRWMPFWGRKPWNGCTVKTVPSQQSMSIQERRLFSLAKCIIAILLLHACLPHVHEPQVCTCEESAAHNIAKRQWQQAFPQKASHTQWRA